MHVFSAARIRLAPRLRAFGRANATAAAAADGVGFLSPAPLLPPQERARLRRRWRRLMRPPKPEEPRWPFSRVLRYFFGGVGGTYLLYNFYHSGGSLHKLELILWEHYACLPIYYLEDKKVYHSSWRPEWHPVYDEKITRLPPDLEEALARWFVQTDLKEEKGVTRGLVLELFEDAGYPLDETKSGEGFLFRGQ